MAPTTDSKGPKAKKAARFKQTTNAGVHKAPKPRRSPDYAHVAPLISTTVSESSTMSQASLPQLPSELKIQIFGFMDSFSTVTTLSCTSRTFNNIWKLNAKHICDAVLQRAIECPVEAKALIDAQQSTRRTKRNQRLKGNRKDQNDYQQAIKRVQPYLVNMNMASTTFKYFEESMLKDPEIDRKLSSTDRAHFMQAYYRSRVLVLLSTDGIPRSLITPWNMLDFKRVCEILDYMVTFYFDGSPRQNSALVSKEESETVLGRLNPVSKCEVALHRMDLLIHDILRVLPEGYLDVPEDDLDEPEDYLDASDHQPFLLFTTYDPRDAKTTDKLRNLPLAEILPLLPEWSLSQEVDLDDVLGELKSW